MFELENHHQTSARIKVIGVGGCGGNAVNNMITSKLRGVEFIAANTDAQDLNASLAPLKIQLGGTRTRGLGAGADPATGREAAGEAKDVILQHVEGADMLFITAGMGGGTGTGAAPVVAREARELGILTVAVVTKPFTFEGKRRTRQAEEGLAVLRDEVDSLLVIPNDRLLNVAGKNATMKDAFGQADQILVNAVRGISDLIAVGGLVNVDFADVRAVMSMRGLSLMGTGHHEGEDRAVEAAHRAIASPLLDNLTLYGARGVLVNITGPEDLKLHEVNEAVSLIQQEAHDDALIIFGTVLDPSATGVTVTVIATGFEQAKAQAEVEERPLAKAVGAEDRDVPTFIRTSRPQPQVVADSPRNIRRMPETSDPYDDARFDIPTFLRKKPD